MSVKNGKKTIIFISLVIFLIVLIPFVLGMIKKNQVAMSSYDKTSPVRVGEVTLTVSDLTNMSGFYQGIIGLQLMKMEDNQALFTADGKTPLLVLEEEKDAVNRPIRTTGLYHFALLLPDQKTLGQYLIHLSEAGYLEGAADHQYSEALYLTDPEGNGIEIYADRPSNEWIKDGKGGYIGGTYQLDTLELTKKSKSEKWSGLPADTRMGHMHLQVTDLEKSERFYVEVLGFNVVAKSDSHLFVSKDGYHHHIGMNIWAGKGIPSPPNNAKGLKHYSIFLTRTEWHEVKDNLIKKNIQFEEKEKTIKVNDPSGIGLQITYKK
ncbi:VOC family protein [Bacillus sp. FJAT-49732]|uniref:VOC family protein n=1 Tax=Lederbergia citrisecunda TaxID=2833583 RepID=A0A942TQB1_9BACI|nr:VOC family protein [Lederbergia citrisecunda]MBS4201598.1 VOC family protein [Lederbergia citrisecunda]